MYQLPAQTSRQRVTPHADHRASLPAAGAASPRPVAPCRNARFSHCFPNWPETRDRVMPARDRCCMRPLARSRLATRNSGAWFYRCRASPVASGSPARSGRPGRYRLAHHPPRSNRTQRDKTHNTRHTGYRDCSFKNSSLMLKQEESNENQIRRILMSAMPGQN